MFSVCVCTHVCTCVHVLQVSLSRPQWDLDSLRKVTSSLSPSWQASLPRMPYSMVVKTQTLGARKPGFKFHLFHIGAVWQWASHLSYSVCESKEDINFVSLKWIKSCQVARMEVLGNKHYDYVVVIITGDIVSLLGAQEMKKWPFFH